MKEKNIYLLEDDSDIQHLITRILTKDGYKVFAFESVKDFKAQLAMGDPDLFILDVSLPDGNGLDISKEINKKDSVAPVLMMSADIVNKEKALASGARNFIGKPFRMDDFRLTVGKLLAA